MAKQMVFSNVCNDERFDAVYASLKGNSDAHPSIESVCAQIEREDMEAWEAMVTRLREVVGFGMVLVTYDDGMWRVMSTVEEFIDILDSYQCIKVYDDDGVLSVESYREDNISVGEYFFDAKILRVNGERLYTNWKEHCTVDYDYIGERLKDSLNSRNLSYFDKEDK